jgi:RNA polymerase sigma-70 factor (ECF subfamily)
MIESHGIERAKGGSFLAATPEQTCDLVNRIECGDRAAESELVDRYARCIKLILLKRTGSAQLSNDLCQDTLMVALRKLRAGELRKPASLSAFIRQTAVNISIDHFRKEKRYVQQDDGSISLHLSHRDHKARNLDTRTTRIAIDSVLDQLAVSRDREILRRFYLADEDKGKICMELKLSSTHFDRVLYRAKQRMRELINRQEGVKSLLFGGLFDV